LLGKPGGIFVERWEGTFAPIRQRAGKPSRSLRPPPIISGMIPPPRWFRSPAGLAFLAASGALALYLTVWSPFVTWSHWGEDGPELEGAARTLGIPHPTGYPLFVLLARVLASVLPAPIAAVNALSLLAGAAAAGASVLAADSLARRAIPSVDPRPAAFVAGILVAVAPLTWGQAAIGEVYTLHLALVAVAAALLFSGRQGLLLAYVLGLLAAHHGASVILLASAVVYLALDPRARHVARSREALVHAAAFLAPITLYGVLLVRSRWDPFFDWGNPETWPGLFWEMTGAPYRGNLLREGWSRTLADAGFALVRLPARELGWGGAGLALAGAGVLARRAPREALMLGVLYAGTVLLTAAYAVPDPAPHLLPAVLVLALAAGVGFGMLLARVPDALPSFRPIARGALGGTAGALLAVQIAVGWKSAGDARDPTAWEMAALGRAVLPEGSLVISRGDGRTFSLWYGTRVLGGREDTAVIYETLLDWPWYRAETASRHPWPRLPPPGLDRERRTRWLVEHHARGRPVFLTDPDPRVLAGYALRPVGALLRVEPAVTAEASTGRRGIPPRLPPG
jgi:hypothetical protein